MAENNIRLNTVGQIGSGEYAGWYVVVVPQEAPGFDTSYSVYVCTDTTFAFDPSVRECYDEWLVNTPSLEGVFEDKYTDVQWDESIAPPQFAAPSAKITDLVGRMRARMNPSAEDDSSGNT